MELQKVRHDWRLAHMPSILLECFISDYFIEYRQKQTITLNLLEKDISVTVIEEQRLLIYEGDRLGFQSPFFLLLTF